MRSVVFAPGIGILEIRTMILIRPESTPENIALTIKPIQELPIRQPGT
jgi:hypothetical protein